MGCEVEKALVAGFKPSLIPSHARSQHHSTCLANGKPHLLWDSKFGNPLSADMVARSRNSKEMLFKRSLNTFHL